MDLNHYFIRINPVGLTGHAATRYVSQVHEHLRWIHKTVSGKLLLNCIRRPNFPIEIRPHADATCNAIGGSEQKVAGAPVTGVVTYTPGAFGHGGSCAAAHGANRSGRLVDEVLFHELIHVFRTATNTWNQGRLVGFAMKQYDSNEEFIAVLCTNIYVSDRSNKIKTGLRAGHRGFAAMTAADAGRFALFASSSEAFTLVKQFCADNPIFTKALSKHLKDVPYNPIADFYQFSIVCQAFSILGPHNDKQRFKEFLRANGIMATVAEMLSNPIKAPSP